MELSERLSALRKEKGLTLRELAEQVGITAAALSTYEKGQKEPSLGYAKKLAQYYGVSLDYLCGEEAVKSVERTISYADVAGMIIALVSYGGGTFTAGEQASHGRVSGMNEEMEWNFELHGEADELGVEMNMKSKKMSEFFNVFGKLKELAASGQIPESVVLDWFKTNIATLRTMKLPKSFDITF